MLKTVFSHACILTSVVTFAVATPSNAAGLSSYVRGAIVDYAHGPGTSSNRPRVEMRVTLCASGTYQTRGRSCRPNIIANGYQCSNFTDAGRWRVSGNQLQWMSANGQPGSLQLYRRGGGFADAKGNRLSRVGNAGC